jgi:alpha-L-fucosidase
MRRTLSVLLIGLLVATSVVLTQAPRPSQPQPASAQAAASPLPAETPAQKEARLAWWTDARFGMFIHWGLYAQAARHEWVKKNERMTDADQKYFELFNPDLYNPREWARMAKQAGMKYAVITSKHHEGFCLFDSRFTDYKATNTPARRDLLKEWVEAFRAEGLKVGFYYSSWTGATLTVPAAPKTKPPAAAFWTSPRVACAS